MIEADATDRLHPQCHCSGTGVLASVMSKEFTGSLAFLLPPLSHRTGGATEVQPGGHHAVQHCPGSAGVILTMTSVLFTAMAMTRVAERGNLENILAMPVCVRRNDGG